MTKNIVLTIVLAGTAIASTGCATHTGEGALLGGAGGAALGAAIGSHSHGRAGEGALLGGILGAVGGGLIGNEMDRQDHGPRYFDDGYDDYDSYGPRHGYGVEYSYERTYYRPRYRRYCRPSRHHHHHHHHHHDHHHHGRRGGYHHRETRHYGRG